MRNKLLFLLLGTSLLVPPFVVAQADGGNTANDTPMQGGDFSSNPQARKVPQNVILVKGAEPGSSDGSTALPEGGSITDKAYVNQYFGLAYSLPAGWKQKYVGPPPSDGGYYVLAQIEPEKTFKGLNPGTILISAQDLFFTPVPADNAVALIAYKESRLSADFKVERPPVEVKIAGHSFVRMDYTSPVAGLHWYTLATEIRCHSVEFLLTSRDTELLEGLIRGMSKMVLPDEAGPVSGKGGGSVPVCIKEYATGNNVLHKVDPVFTGHKFNAVPARIVIDKYGKVKHVHVISAFPDQTKAILDALMQWEFRPYRQNGQPVEVETGIVFGGPPHARKASRTARALAE